MHERDALLGSEPPPQRPSSYHNEVMLNEIEPTQSSNPIDLVGSPFAVLESDPAVFTSLSRKLGIRNVELVELYDIEAWATDVPALDPLLGLIFCFMWRKEEGTRGVLDSEDEDVRRIWFANQLSDDACATQALLNVVLNCPGVDVGERMREFKRDTEEMSSVMKGLAISNHPLLREAHNSLARPADVRAAVHAVANKTLKAAEKRDRPPPAKRARTTTKTTKKDGDEGEAEETYHFIGYFPAHGKVWEADGLKRGPLEVGEIPSSSSSEDGERGSRSKGWMDVARPALRMKMRKYGAENIRFSLLALVEGGYERVRDGEEWVRRERVGCVRGLGEGWEGRVDPSALALAPDAEGSPTRPYFPDFAHRRLHRDVALQRMSEAELLAAWEGAVRDGVQRRLAVQEELGKAERAQTEHEKRVHDYEPFFRKYTGCLQREGMLMPLLGRDESGKKVPVKANKSKGMNGK